MTVRFHNCVCMPVWMVWFLLPVCVSVSIYLLPGPKTLFLDRYYFHPRVCVCLSVCGWVCSPIISKSSWPILMKLGRMMHNHKRQVPFEDGMNRFGRTHTSPIWNVEIAIFLTKCSGEFVKTSQNGMFYHLMYNLWIWEILHS